MPTGDSRSGAYSRNVDRGLLDSRRAEIETAISGRGVGATAENQHLAPAGGPDDPRAQARRR